MPNRSTVGPTGWFGERLKGENEDAIFWTATPPASACGSSILTA